MNTWAVCTETSIAARVRVKPSSSEFGPSPG